VQKPVLKIMRTATATMCTLEPLEINTVKSIFITLKTSTKSPRSCLCPVRLFVHCYR